MTQIDNDHLPDEPVDIGAYGADVTPSPLLRARIEAAARQHVSDRSAPTGGVPVRRLIAAAASLALFAAGVAYVARTNGTAQPRVPSRDSVALTMAPTVPAKVERTIIWY